MYVENEVTYRTCDSCHKRKIVYPRLAGAYGDIIVSDITSYKNPSKGGVELPLEKGEARGIWNVPEMAEFGSTFVRNVCRHCERGEDVDASST